MDAPLPYTGAAHFSFQRSRENDHVNKSRLITIACVILAIVIAWILVNVVLGVLVFVAKLALVAVVAALVYVVIRFVLRATD